jgi:hypothetical protein
MRFGYTRLGAARLIPRTEPLVLVKVGSSACIPAIQARLGEVLDDSIDRRCS